MSIDVLDHRFDRLRGLSETDAVAERDTLITEARDLLRRSDDHLDPADEDRIAAIENDLEFLAHRHNTRQHIIELASRSGCVENGTTFDTSQDTTTRALQGAQTLTRDQNLTDWVHDNDRNAADIPPAGGFDSFLRGVVTGDWRGAEEVRALSEGISAAGGVLVPTPLAANVIDLARNQMQVIAAGAITIPMTSATLKVPRLVGEGAPAWRLENSPVTAGDLSFDAVTFTAKSLDRLVILSRELFEDSDPSAGDIISQSFAAQLALELDRVALRGSGVDPEPLGVRNTAGVTVTAHGTDGTAITDYDWLLDAQGTVLGNNFQPTAHIAAPRTATSLGKLKDTQGNYLTPPAQLLPILPSNQVPTNLAVGTSTDCSEIYTGAWSFLGIGLRTNFEIRFLQERYADTQQVAFLAHLRADVQVLQPKAITIDTGVR
ncbi:phage major capsid protein [Rhodococcus koreensis]